MFESRLALSAQHPGYLFLARFSRYRRQTRMSASANHFLCHHELPGRRGRNLGQMGDAQDLMIRSEFSHLCSHCVCDLAADIGVDLVKNEERDRIVGSQR